MYQGTACKHWYPTVIDSLCPDKRSYKIKTSDGVFYRKTHAHLKLYTKNLQSDHMQQVKQPMTQPDYKKVFTSE